MGIYKHVQNIVVEDKNALSKVVIPKIINSDVGFQLYFGKMETRESISTKVTRNEESIRVSDHYGNY
jgi:hypothetical protein